MIEKELLLDVTSVSLILTLIFLYKIYIRIYGSTTNKELDFFPGTFLDSLLISVPYQVALKARFGKLDSDSIFNQQIKLNLA